MSSTDSEEKSIVVRAAQRRRYTDTNGRTTRRTIRFNGPILSSDLDWARVGDEITVWCEEASQTQVIGSLRATADEEHRLAPVFVILPRDAFVEFWAAASDANAALAQYHDQIRRRDDGIYHHRRSPFGGNSNASSHCRATPYATMGATTAHRSACGRCSVYRVRDPETDVGIPAPALSRTEVRNRLLLPPVGGCGAAHGAVSRGSSFGAPTAESAAPQFDNVRIKD
jgi:hypothetical protein